MHHLFGRDYNLDNSVESLRNYTPPNATMPLQSFSIFQYHVFKSFCNHLGSTRLPSSAEVNLIWLSMPWYTVMQIQKQRLASSGNPLLQNTLYTQTGTRYKSVIAVLKHRKKFCTLQVSKYIKIFSVYTEVIPTTLHCQRSNLFIFYI